MNQARFVQAGPTALWSLAPFGGVHEAGLAQCLFEHAPIDAGLEPDFGRLLNCFQRLVLGEIRKSWTASP
jgi:hypothetical protein